MLTAPAITGVSPAFPAATGSAETLTINGTNFQSGCTVTLWDGTGTAFTDMPISSQSSTQIVIDPNFGTSQDVWSVEVINPGSSDSQRYYFPTTPSGVPQPDALGVDYSDARPTPSSLTAAGSSFAVRYVSTSGNSKNISLSEAQSLLAAGQQIIIVDETTGTEMENGESQGVTDADAAVTEAEAAGAPSNFFCYFAADFDPDTQTLLNDIDQYLQGADSVLGVSRVGIYGGYAAVQSALAGGYASKGWQTEAWSSGEEYSGVTLFQNNNATSFISGCDADVGIGSNWGQWTPAGLSASATGFQSISVTWSTMGAASGYKLDRATSSSGPWTQVYSGSGASYTDTGVQGGTKYYYEVCGTNGNGSTSFSPSVSATTPTGVPTGLAATATGSSTISVSWNTMSGATSYTLQRSTSANGTYTQIYTGSTASYSDSGLQANTTYYYEVKSNDSTGSSAYSSSVNATTFPATPTGLAATPTGSSTISVSWSTVSGATSYTLQRSTSASGAYTSVYTGATASYSDSGLQGGTTYYYEVDASAGTESSAYSSAVSALTYPATPTGLSGSPSSPHKISVSWNAMTGATTYTLQTATSSSGPWTQLYSGPAVSYADSGLQPATTYYFEIRSGNSSGNSAYSSAASATPSPTVSISSPGNNQALTTFPITVSGTATDTGGGGLSNVTVDNTANGSTASEVLSGNSASYSIGGITLVPGSNVIDVESFDNLGDYSVVATVTVNYSPPTWNGGGAPSVNWSAAANWGGTSIAPGNDLAFAGSTGLSNNNDLAAGTQFDNLTFSSNAGAFTLGGNSIILSGVITNYSSTAETIALPLGGTYGLTKTGPGPVILSGTNNFTGGTAVLAGILNIANSAALPTGDNLIVGANALAEFGPIDG